MTPAAVERAIRAACAADPVTEYQQDERAIKAECDALAGEPGFCFWPRCDCEKLPDEVKRRRREQETY